MRLLPTGIRAKLGIGARRLEHKAACHAKKFFEPPSRPSLTLRASARTCDTMPMLLRKHSLAASFAKGFACRVGLLFHGHASIARRDGLGLSKSEVACCISATDVPNDRFAHHECRCAVAAKGLLAPRTMPGSLKEKIAHALRVHESILWLQSLICNRIHHENTRKTRGRPASL